MRIVLTGATGYLGSCLARRLLDKGHELLCIVRRTDRLGRLQGLSERVALLPSCGFEKGMADFAPETVIHTACTYSRGGNTRSDILDGNLIFPLRVMWAAEEIGVRRWINTATMMPPMLNAYALSKDQMRQWGEMVSRDGGIQFINLVLEHFYGPNAPADQFIPWMIDKLRRGEALDLTLGTQRRDFVSVDDVLNVYEAALTHPFEERYADIGVGTGCAPTIREVVEYLKDITGSSSALNFGAVPARRDEPDSCCDTRKLRLLGLAPPVQWKEGMQALVKAQNIH